jgi:hypothetical protein
MNSNGYGADFGSNGLGNLVHFVGQTAAVSIAKDDDISAGFGGRRQDLHCVVSIVFVTVVKMLGVEDSLETAFF